MKVLAMYAFLLLVPIAVNAQSGPVMTIATGRSFYQNGDSLTWQCDLSGFGRSYSAVSLQIWIENIGSGERWKFRYPVLNGYAEGAMRIGDDIPPGRYALNFMLQADFFNVSGKLRNRAASDSVLNYFVIFKDRESLLRTTPLARDGAFDVRGIVFQDTAMFTFSRTGRNAGSPSMNITTSLDSAFTPAVPVITKFISIGGGAKAADTSGSFRNYRFDAAPRREDARQLNEIVVKDRKSNKLVKDYEKAYVSPAFQAADAITIDALSNDDAVRMGDIYQFLATRVPGITTSNDPSSGGRVVLWRNQVVGIYLDEFRLQDGMPLTVHPSEVAIIKVYRPGNGPMTGGMSGGAAIAIYTKVGPYTRLLPQADGNNRFYVRGYDALSTEWTSW